jgi:tetratricopeptide (TPR) repeat protein
VQVIILKSIPIRFARLLLLALSLAFGACSLEEEDNREQMVDLQHVKVNPEAQLANLNAAISQSGRDGSLYARRAAVLLRVGDLQKALEDANEAVRLTRNDPYSLFVKAQVLRSMGKPKEALPLALQAERNSYQSSAFYVLLGELYLQRKEYSQAQEYLNKAQELSPNDEVAFYYKGRVAEATGDTAAAIRNYKLALQQKPSFLEPQRELSGLLVAQKEFAAARPYIIRAQRVAPQDGRLWYYKGLVYQAEQRQDSATLAFHKALSISDTLQGVHYRLGVQEHALGNNEAALDHLQKAVDFKDQPRYLRTMASAYERTGQYMNSLASYQRLAEVEPEYTYAKQAITRLKYKVTKPLPASTVVPQVQTEQ